MHQCTPSSAPGSIRRFLEGRVLLVTGVTGFLGKAIVEKILRCCPEVARVYLLIRPRSGQASPESSVGARLELEVLAAELFDPLRQRLGERFDALVAEKLVAVPGDLSLERLGLSEAWWQRLASEVDVIINSAATVVFDERLDMALELNALGPVRLLDLAHAGKVLGVLHISTAYTSGVRTDEVPPAPVPQKAPGDSADGSVPMLPADIPGTVAKLLEECRQIVAECKQEASPSGRGADRLDRQVRQRLVDRGMACARAHGWNDTYTFTKALGEHMVIEHRRDLPTVILRPAIIESSLREPLPGWIDGLRMLDPLIIAYGRRLLSLFPADPSIMVDLIPLDFVVHGTLGALPQLEKGNGLRIFHVATSSENPLSFRNLVAYAHDHFVRNPMRNKKGQPIRVRHWPFSPPEQFEQELQRRHRQARTLQALLRKLPGTRRLRARLAAMQSGLDRLEYYSRIYGPYARLNIRFDTRSTRELYESLPLEEQELFPFDVTRIDWRHYVQNVHIPGLRKNVLKLDEEGPSVATEPTESPPATEVPLDGAAPPRDDPSEPAPFPMSQDDGEWLDVPVKTAGGGAPLITAHAATEATGGYGAGILDRMNRINGMEQGTAPTGSDRVDPVDPLQEPPSPRSSAPPSPSLFQRSPLQHAARQAAWNLNHLVLRRWFRLKVEGLEHLPSSGPFLIASNHTSHLDYAALFAASGVKPSRAFALGARDYFFNTPLRAAVFTTLNVLPFDRRGNFAEDLQVCRLALEQGHILVIFPEGTRSADGELLPFKPGIGMLALETGVPIVPAYIHGAFDALPKGARWPRRCPMRIVFGPPLDIADYTQQRGAVSNHRIYRAIVDDLRTRIEALRKRDA